MDVSEGMVEKYNITAREQGISESKMHAVQGDLMAPEVDPSLAGEDLFNFDLVVICMALHHLENPQEAVKRLVNRLKVGGVLVIIDWATGSEKYRRQQETKKGNNDGGAHHDHRSGRYPAAHTVAHDSFAREQIEGALKDAGCSETDFVLASKPSVVPMATGGQMQLFFARGKKGAS